MIVIEHKKSTVTNVIFGDSQISEFIGANAVYALAQLSAEYPNQIIVWFDKQVKHYLNLENIESILNQDRKLISYAPVSNYFSSDIGYIEESPYININKNITYPTWLMSSCVGAAFSQTIAQFDSRFFQINNLDLFLNSVAKHYMPLGLFCYSEPRLLQKKTDYIQKQASIYELFRFVNQHYKSVWKYLLFLNLILYNKKIKVIPLLQSMLICKKKYKKEIHFNDVTLEVNHDFQEETIDVIIPTMGRKQYLYDVLTDLKAQTHLPRNVIIVEQNAIENSVSELDYLENESWPFKIEHIFINQIGVCNARNIALKHAKSDWLFLADDDIKFSENFIKDGLKQMKLLSVDAAIFSCLVPNSVKNNNPVSQTTIFGSGCSIINREKSVNIFFSRELEFGYGEDADFGLQLRNRGIDVVYLPIPEIVHLKAAMGGFRYVHSHPWNNSKVKPIPSPTVLMYKKKFYTIEQLKCYKTVLFINSMGKEKGLKKLLFLSEFLASWEASKKWVLKLSNENK